MQKTKLAAGYAITAPFTPIRGPLHTASRLNLGYSPSPLPRFAMVKRRTKSLHAINHEPSPRRVALSIFGCR